MKLLDFCKVTFLALAAATTTFSVQAQSGPKDFVVVKPDQVVWGDAPGGVK